MPESVVPSSSGRPPSPARPSPGRPSPGWLPVVRLAGIALVTAAALLLAAACGSAPAPRGNRPAGPATRAAARADVPVASVRAAPRPANPRATATAMARHLLYALRLPAGSRSIAVPARPIRDLPTTATGFADTVTLTRLYRLTVPMSAAYRWLLAQRPAGAVLTDHGPFGQRHRVVAELAGFSVLQLPSWLYSARLSTAVKQAAGGSLLLAQAQVQWYPPRSPADYVDPARYASVTVSRTRNGHTTARTLTGAPMRRLAAAANALHAVPGIAVACPAVSPKRLSYQLTFNPAGSAPRVVLDPTMCLLVNVSAGGHKAQQLFPASPLIAAMARSLGSAAGSG